MQRPNIVSAIPLILALSACGGGGSGSTPQASPSKPATPEPSATPTPVPPAPPATPLPVVSAISPDQAFIGTAATFSVSGSYLVDGMKFSLTDCDNVVEIGAGSSTQRQFRCTPSGQPGLRKGALYTSASGSAPLVDVSVTYRLAVAAAVTNLDWRYAVLKSDGSLWTWNPQQPAPVKVGDDYADVAVSTYATLAIKKDGSLWSWGVSNWEGIQGNGTMNSNTEPKQIGTDFVKVVVKGENTTGGESAEAIKKDGSLWVWGARSLMQPQAVGAELSPRMIDTGYVDIARGSGGESLGLKRDGSLWTWNRNLSDHPFEPVKVAQGYVALASSYDAAYGLKADGSLWNWGRNAPGQPGGVVPTVSAPAKVGDGFVSISAGLYYALALKSDGTLWAGGNGLQGQFGEGQASGGDFRQVNSGIAAAWAGSSCSFMKKTDGSLWAAGYCDLGDGKFTRYIYTPEQAMH